nr:PREDICTED: protein ENL [Equus przewalskii]
MAEVTGWDSLQFSRQCTVQVKLELGHRAQLRKKPTTEGFTHDWMVFVRGPEQCEIQHFVEKVVFRLHDSFPKPKRVCKEPPYKVEESGYAGFIMPIEVYFKNKEEPRKVCFTYDLFLNLEGNPPVNHLRCEKLTFNNPTVEFRYKLLLAGGVMVMPEGAETVSRPSPDYPMLPTIPLSAFSDPKKTKPPHGSKDASREGSKACKSHKTTKEHRERPRKDSESKGPSKEPEREQPRSTKDAARKLGEGRPPKEEKAPPPKAAFKEPKMALKETKLESMSPKGGPPPPPPAKSSSKRPAAADSPKPSAKKQKKSSSKGSRSAPGTSPRTSSSSFSDRKPAKDKGSAKGEKVKAESEPREVKKPPEVEESNSEDEASFKTEVRRLLPAPHPVLSSPGSEPPRVRRGYRGPQPPLAPVALGKPLQLAKPQFPLLSGRKPCLQHCLLGLHGDFEGGSQRVPSPSEWAHFRDSCAVTLQPGAGCTCCSSGCLSPRVARHVLVSLSRQESPASCSPWGSVGPRVSGTRLSPGLGPGVMGSVPEHCLLARPPGGRCLMGALSASRLSFSDSESDNSADSCLPSREPPPPKKPPPPNSKASGRRSPESGSKPEKILKRGTYDKAYTDELVELHRRLMALRERNVLQQIVNLIEETGHFNVTNTTFDFDLFSLDETTVRKLQSYLEAVAT